MSQWQIFLTVLPARWRRKPADIDMEENYVTVILCVRNVQCSSIMAWNNRIAHCLVLTFCWQLHLWRDIEGGAYTPVLGQLTSMGYFGKFIGSLALGLLLTIAGYEFVFGAIMLLMCACVPTIIFCMHESVEVVKSDSAEAQSIWTRSEVIRRQSI